MAKRLIKFLQEPAETSFLTLPHTIAVATLAIVTFHAAYTFEQCSFLIAVYLYFIIKLAWVKSTRVAFYLGLVVGPAIFVPHLLFFWRSFGPLAIPLWALAGIYAAAVLVMCRLTMATFSRIIATLLIPFVWTGCEYFRSELQPLRFSWLLPTYAFYHNPQFVFLNRFGVYGVTFFIMLATAILSLLSGKKTIIGKIFLLMLLAAAVNIKTTADDDTYLDQSPFVIGIQVEPAVAQEPTSLAEIMSYLNDAIEKHPSIDIVVLPELTFLSPPPSRILSWCEQNRCYIIMGGLRKISPQSDSTYNSAFVVSPEGKIVFEQAKRVPVPFLEDSLPAKEQKLWNSPLGQNRYLYLLGPKFYASHRQTRANGSQGAYSSICGYVRVGQS